MKKTRKTTRFFEATVVIIVVLVFVTPGATVITTDKLSKNLNRIGTDPAIIINFAGNLSDLGGPHWQPPYEGSPLTGQFENGYYTNDSRQQEDWIYINVTITDVDGVDEVWLHWYNATGNTWTNNSYHFIHTGGNFWEFNSSGNITDIAAGCDYSFDIYAVDTIGDSSTLKWEKKGPLENHVRRYVQLGCTPTDVAYTPYYCYEASPYLLGPGPGSVEEDEGAARDRLHQEDEGRARDRLHHDQGPDGGRYDTGYLRNTLPTDTVQERHCGLFFGYWFDESICPKSFTLINIYQHFWWTNLSEISENNGFYAGWAKHDGMLPPVNHSYVAETKSNVTFDSWKYHLNAKLLTLPTPVTITDNNIYELVLVGIDSKSHTEGAQPSSISNRSFVSFVILNVPDNDTLNASHYDTDGDSLTDWEELYQTYTSPFLADTDNDGVSDYLEHLLGSDPNNYKDIVVISRADFDMDGDVDLADYAKFSQCFAGAGNPPAASCSPDMFEDGFCKADFDHDGDIDLSDFAYFAQCFGGAGNSPNC